MTSASGPEFSGCALVRIVTVAPLECAAADVPPNARPTVSVLLLTLDTRRYSFCTTITSPSANSAPEATESVVAPADAAALVVDERTLGASSTHLWSLSAAGLRLSQAKNGASPAAPNRTAFDRSSRTVADWSYVGRVRVKSPGASQDLPPKASVYPHPAPLPGREREHGRRLNA